MIKAGAYGIFKTVFNIIGWREMAQHKWPILPVLIISFITILLGSACAITQTETKRMLAYSSISQIGYIIMGFALLNELSVKGGLIHILAHTAMKGLLFLTTGAFIHQAGILKIEDLKGIGKRMPVTAFAFSISALSMIGLPPFIGFISKWFLALGSLKAINAGTYWGGLGLISLLILLVSSLLNLVYYGPVVISFWLGEGVEIKTEHPQVSEKRIVGENDPPLTMLIPLIILMAGVIIYGIFPILPPLNTIGGILAYFF